MMVFGLSISSIDLLGISSKVTTLRSPKHEPADFLYSFYGFSCP
jgi:hypothetical protein